MSETCMCPRTDGFRIRRHGCPVHNECLDSVGPIPKLDGDIYVCVKPRGHEMPHESPNGAWWNPPPAALSAHLAPARDGETSGEQACVHCGEVVEEQGGWWTHRSGLSRCQSPDVEYGHLAHPARVPCRADGPNPCLGAVRDAGDGQGKS